MEGQKFEKVGSNRTIYVDIRFICATNKRLDEMIKADKFRHELYYRINTIILEIPPLRERADDIPLLINHFIAVNVKEGKTRPKLTSQAYDLLTNYSWPGNVRELSNIIERLCIMHGGEEITARHLPREIIESQKPSTKEEKEKLEREQIKKADD